MDPDRNPNTDMNLLSRDHDGKVTDEWELKVYPNGEVTKAAEHVAVTLTHLSGETQ